MRVIFLGDISIDKPHQHPGTFSDALQSADAVFANLEGPIVDKRISHWTNPFKKYSLHSSTEVLGFLKLFNVNGVYLANNHIFDLGDETARNTIQILATNGIDGFGAGQHLMQAGEPFVISKGVTTLKLFAFGWNVIGCGAAGPKRSGVNPLHPQHALNTVRQLRAIDKSSCAIFIFHWNYELERYPQPAHRQLAHDLILEGVDAVIGVHSHVAQGAERIYGKPVVYDLGNWFLPSRELGHIQLAYPEVSARQLALELEIEGRQVRNTKFHWHRFDSRCGLLQHTSSEGWNGSLLSHLTPFAGFSRQQYLDWFKQNRKRRKGLPIYADYRLSSINRTLDLFVGLRQLFITPITTSAIEEITRCDTEN